MMKTFKHSRKTANGGFTLLELMITLAVMAILLAWGFPSLNESIKNNRMTAQNNEMIAILQYARSEAIRRNTDVEVHLGADGSDWETFIKDPDFVADIEGCALGQLRCSANDNVTVSYDLDVGTDVITFNNRGYIRDLDDPWTPESLFLEHDECRGDNQRRRIDIMPTGQISSCSVACGSEAQC